MTEAALSKVTVSTWDDGHPILDIREVDGPDIDTPSYAIPASLLTALEATQEACERIEYAIMEYIAERHPEATAVISWLRA